MSFLNHRQWMFHIIMNGSRICGWFQREMNMKCSDISVWSCNNNDGWWLGCVGYKQSPANASTSDWYYFWSVYVKSVECQTFNLSVFMQEMRCFCLLRNRHSNKRFDNFMSSYLTWKTNAIVCSTIYHILNVFHCANVTLLRFKKYVIALTTPFEGQVWSRELAK